MKGKQHYMTYPERIKLETLRDEKRGVSYIAKTLGFSRQTIYNELKVGSYMHDYGWCERERYSADRAEAIHRTAQSNKGTQLKIGNDHDYAAFLEKKIIKDKYSPAAALAEARRNGFAIQISVGTLYSYIDKGIFLHLSNKDLLVKSQKKHHKQPNRRIAHPKLPSIADRPNAINQREEPGHWEMDLVVGKAGTKPVLLTLTERMSRKEMIFLLPDKRAASIRKVFDNLENEMPDFKDQFKTITTDNGSEFLQYDQLRRSTKDGLRFDIYYCHSYSAWEKGTNENHNRMIRRFFPKGTDFSQITESEVKAVEHWMNHYPRKILGWNRPCDIAV